MGWASSPIATGSTSRDGGFLPRAAARTTSAARRAAALTRRSAVLIGGGKDSIVSTEILRAGGEPVGSVRGQSEAADRSPA